MVKGLNEMLKIAGLPLREEDKLEQHIADEKDLFGKTCDNLEQVIKMADERLKGELEPMHKTQYTELKKCATECCDHLKKHLESYK